MNYSYSALASAFVLFAVFIIFITGCGKEQNVYEKIPYAPVDVYIQPNSTQYQRLNTVGGWEYINAQEPSRGLIVYRASQNEFKAYERTCPHDPEKPAARVEMEENYLIAVDSTCMSRFVLTDGSPFDGPSRLPLKEYRTSFDGNTLHIYN
ncbi:MAG: hypothetical protein K9I94_14215 [Bacteroidales bacterium]|nr:hypothetical protein [Bacteroidales bacterium]